MRRTINELRRDAAKRRRKPKFIMAIKRQMAREARDAMDRGYFPSKLLGVFEERLRPEWIGDLVA